MTGLNRVLLIGRLTRDPDLRYTGHGRPVCTVGMALHRHFRKRDGSLGETVCFVDLQTADDLAEQCGKRFKKGEEVLVDGRLWTHQWKSRKTGQDRSKLMVLATSIEPLGTL